MENYYSFLKKNKLRKEYNFVKNTRNFLPVIGGKLPELAPPINSTHAMYRKSFFTFNSIPVKSGMIGGDPGIKLQFIPIGEKPPTMTRDQVNNALNTFGEFIVDKLKIIPPQQGYYKEQKKQTSEEKLEKRLLGNYTCKLKQDIDLKKLTKDNNIILNLDTNLSYQPKNNVILYNLELKLKLGGEVIDYNVNTGKMILKIKHKEGDGISSEWDVKLFGYSGPLSYEESYNHERFISSHLNLESKKLIKKSIEKNKKGLKSTDSNIDILDKVLDGIRPTIADLIQHKIKFLPIVEPMTNQETIEDYNNLWEVLSRSGKFGGNTLNGKMLARKVAQELVKDYPDFEEYILETTYKNINMNIILTVEKIFNFKIIFISKFDAKDDKIQIYKQPEKLKKVDTNGGIGNRDVVDEFVDKNIRTTVLTGVKNNYTDNLMDYSLIYYNPQYQLKQFSDKNKQEKVKELNKYLPYQMISIREGMMMCQNFIENNITPSFYVFLGYVNNDIFQLISIDSKTQVDAETLPYDIKKFIVDSCSIYKEKDDYKGINYLKTP